MANRHSATQFIQDALGEHIPHQAHVLVERQFPIVDGRDAAGFLAPVLEGIQAIVNHPGTVSGGVVYSKHTALLIGML